MRVKVNLNKAADLERVWNREVIFEWRNKRVNDQIGDQLSSLVAEQVGWALLGPGVKIGSIDQEFTDFGDSTREMRLDPQTRGLLRFYMEEKLGAAGLSAAGGRPTVYRADVLVRGFYRAQMVDPDVGPMGPPEFTITLYLRLLRKGDKAEEPMAQARIDHAWKETFPMDSGTADALTSRVVELLGAALREGDGAALQSLR